ncbi:hypothetical protein Scep_028533 [Stephania cephalantha]|uniref:Uncharacterized protein n=1 Tax=Stephania cephalantha TaxID=152367 RepID=A0AAP0EA47_9MAGN
MTKGNIKPREILDTLKKKDASNASTLRTIYNARQSIGLRKREITNATTYAFIGCTWVSILA